MNQFLNLISNKKITMLKDIDKLIDITKTGNFKYFYINNMEIAGINSFIHRLHEDAVYTIIPMISMFAKDNDPHLILSKQILITKYSSYITVNEFLVEQLNTFLTDFYF
jgi:hypothetical protein